MTDKDFQVQIDEFKEALEALDKAIAEMKRSPMPKNSNSKLFKLMDEVHVLEKQIKNLDELRT